MKIKIIYSSVTGNTARLATYMNEKLNENEKYSLEVFRAQDFNADSIIPEADLYIIAFWCRRSSMDDKSQSVLEKLSDKSVIAIGTIGGDSAGDYAKRVEETVKGRISDRNRCIAVKVCQGSVNMNRIEKRRALPADDPHFVSDERYKRYKGNLGRPDESDMAKVWDSIREKLESCASFYLENAPL